MLETTVIHQMLMLGQRADCGSGAYWDVLGRQRYLFTFKQRFQAYLEKKPRWSQITLSCHTIIYKLSIRYCLRIRYFSSINHSFVKQIIIFLHVLWPSWFFSEYFVTADHLSTSYVIALLFNPLSYFTLSFKVEIRDSPCEHVMV